MVELVKPLLSKIRRGKFIDVADGEGNTALHISAREEHKRVMKLLLRYNADTSIKNSVSW